MFICMRTNNIIVHVLIAIFSVRVLDSYCLPSLQSRPAFGERGLRLGGHPDMDSVCVCVKERERGGRGERWREK